MTDEQLIDAYMRKQSYEGTARVLGVSRQAVEQKVSKLRGLGVTLPGAKVLKGKRIYTPERIRELNELVQSYDFNKK